MSLALAGSCFSTEPPGKPQTPSLYPVCSPTSSRKPTPVSAVSSLILKDLRSPPASGPLHLLFLHPEILFPCFSICLFAHRASPQRSFPLPHRAPSHQHFASFPPCLTSSITPLGPVVISLQLAPCAHLFPTLWSCGRGPLILLLQCLLRSASRYLSSPDAHA